MKRKKKKKTGQEVRPRKQKGMQAFREAAIPSAALFPESRLQRD